jgi:hypothetical protein
MRLLVWSLVLVELRIAALSPDALRVDSGLHVDRFNVVGPTNWVVGIVTVGIVKLLLTQYAVDLCMGMLVSRQPELLNR